MLRINNCGCDIEKIFGKKTLPRYSVPYKTADFGLEFVTPCNLVRGNFGVQLDSAEQGGLTLRAIGRFIGLTCLTSLLMCVCVGRWILAQRTKCTGREPSRFPSTTSSSTTRRWRRPSF